MFLITKDNAKCTGKKDLDSSQYLNNTGCGCQMFMVFKNGYTDNKYENKMVEFLTVKQDTN